MTPGPSKDMCQEKISNYSHNWQITKPKTRLKGSQSGGYVDLHTVLTTPRDRSFVNIN